MLVVGAVEDIERKCPRDALAGVGRNGRGKVVLVARVEESGLYDRHLDRDGDHHLVAHVLVAHILVVREHGHIVGGKLVGGPELEFKTAVLAGAEERLEGQRCRERLPDVDVRGRLGGSISVVAGRFLPLDHRHTVFDHHCRGALHRDSAGGLGQQAAEAAFADVRVVVVVAVDVAAGRVESQIRNAELPEIDLAPVVGRNRVEGFVIDGDKGFRLRGSLHFEGVFRCGLCPVLE